MTEEHATIVSREGFLRFISTSLGLERVRGDEHIFLDLAFDSLSVLEMEVCLEDLGVQVDPDFLHQLTTLDDWYRAYAVARAATSMPAQAL